MMPRRRFLTLTAAALATPVWADAPVIDWQGAGLGTTLSLRLVGAGALQAQKIFAQVEAEIARIEATASLHCDSALVRLNRDGHLAYPPQGLLDLLTLAGRVHDATDGAFDPSVQPLWLATALNGNTAAARALIGWSRVHLSPQEIRLAPGQALTLNGIAQGWAGDRIAALLGSHGFGNALIDMGEVQALGHRADGRPWRAQIESPGGLALAETTLTNRALATSSPRGTLIGTGQPHIIGREDQPPRWSTVSVSADSAAVADALSTAFTLMNRGPIKRALAAFPQATVETMI